MRFARQYEGQVLVAMWPFSGPFLGPSVRGLRILATLLCCCLSGLSQPSVVSPRALSEWQHRFLRQWFGLTDRALSQAATGKPAAMALSSSDPKELAVAGLVWIDGPLSAFVQSQRLLAERDGNRHVRGAEIFSQPPHMDDVASLRLDAQDLAELARCRPADCGLKLYAQDLRRLHHPGAQSDASPDAWNGRFRQVLLQRLAAYQTLGNGAMGEFADKPETTIGAREFETLLRHSPYLRQLAPGLHTYLETYPARRPDGAEDMFYWSHVEFGLKPTVRLNHLVIHQTRHEGVPWVIASKQIFSTHYLQAALELRMVLLPPGGDGRHGFYLLTINRSRNDGLDSAWAGLLRRIVRTKAVDGVARYLAFTRDQTQSPALRLSLLDPKP